ncbi:MAG: methyltransferase [Opitutae bacterium]|nr:methyltransferase [Opitutae bacterium]
MNKPSAWQCKLRHLWLKIRFMLSRRKPVVYTLRDKISFIAFHDNLHSQDIFVRRSYEDKDIQWCMNWLNDGDDFIDCGANIGYYSACLSQVRKLNKVVAVEGNFKCAEKCRSTFENLSLRNIATVNKILHSNETDNLQINDMPGEEGLQHARKIDQGASSVPATTLDQLTKCEDLRPSLIKIDCEGAESEILKGSSALLADVRPAWIIEVNDEALGRAGSNREEMFSLLRDNRYLLFHLSSAFHDFPFGIEVDTDFQSWSFNLAAIPMEQPAVDRWRSSKIVPSH